MTAHSAPLLARIMVRLMLVAILCSLTAEATPRRQRTTRPGRLQTMAPAQTIAPVVAADTIVPPRAAEMIVLRGYDKPLRGSRETLHITSQTARHISAIGLEITYLDTSGRMLHRREAEIRLDLPPGQTLKASIPTWDTNRSYYYKGGPKPRVSGVTPYDISCRVLYVACRPDTSTEQNPQTE